jgi:hypothetical protein
MREKFIKNNWEYEIHDLMSRGEYGFRVDIYKNKFLVKSQSGFGYIGGAEQYARDYFLLIEFGIERGYNND